MTKPMTPQERAATQYTMNDLFRMAMDGKVNIVEDKFVYASALQQTRRAALLEAAQVAITYGERARDEDLSGGYTSELIAQALDRLAQEG